MNQKAIIVFCMVSLSLFLQKRLFAQDNLESAIQLDSIQVNDSMILYQPDYSSYEYVPEFSADTIKARLEAIEGEIPLHYNNVVRSFINYFTVTDRAYTKKVAALQTKYFPMIEKYLKKYNLPEELKYLAIVESGLNPRAKSPAGAVGLWQFMPLTARLDYGLYENWYQDEKMDMEKATDAACRYLTFLYNYFDQDWYLALAAYNSGPGNVRKAIRRSGYKKSFWSIYPYLFPETRSYVPQFIAINYSLNYLDEHNFIIEEQHFLPEYEVVPVSGFLNLKEFATHADICFSTIEELNPELKHHVVSEKENQYALRVPLERLEWLQENLDSVLALSRGGENYYQHWARNEVGSTYGRQKLVYQVKSGDVLGTIAQRYEVRIADIREWNNIRGNLIRVGQNLNIWIADDFYDEVNQKLKAKSQQGLTESQIINDHQHYRVQYGDTLWDISRKFEGLSVEKLKKLNNLEGDAIKPGQVLKISDKSS